MKKAIIAYLLCASFLAFNLFYFIDFAEADFGDSGWAGSEILVPNRTIHNDFQKSKTSGDAYAYIDGDPGSVSLTGGKNTLYWETNDTYLYWGNATSTIDTDSDWGIGKGIYALSDPVGTSEYWTVNVTYWVIGFAFLSPSWTEIGTYSFSASGLWCAGNLGVGITSSPTSNYIQHSQMHLSESQDGWWWINGNGFTDAPPTGWMRPEGGTEAYPFLTHTLYNRPFTLEEVRNMAVIIELSFLTTIFGNLAFSQAGSGLAIGIGGLAVEAIPVDYTPPDYSSGFILRPESDATGDNWKTKVYATTNLYDQIDENNTGSDQDTSYIYANWTSVNTGTTYAQFLMTDTPEYAEDTTYTAYLWVIMKSDYQDYNALAITGFTFENATLGMWYIGSVGVSESWANYSMDFLPISKSGEIAGTPIPGPFTLSQLDKIVGSVYLFPYQNSSDDYGAYLGKLKISQLAIFCVPASVPDSDALIAEISMNSLIWLIIIYLPALAIAQFVPKLGFVAGMSLMLGVFGLAQAGFFPISVMGFVAMMVALYKDS